MRLPSRLKEALVRRASWPESTSRRRPVSVDQPPVGTEGGFDDIVVMAAKNVQEPAAACVPDSRGPVAPSRDDELPVGAERDGVQRRTLAEHVHGPSGLCAPDPRRPVHARRRDESAVAAERTGRNRAVVAENNERAATPDPGGSVAASGQYTCTL